MKTLDTYDAIGRLYSTRRQPDPRLAARLHALIGGDSTVLNVGAGTGSYEPVRSGGGAERGTVPNLAGRRVGVSSEGALACSFALRLAAPRRLAAALAAAAPSEDTTTLLPARFGTVPRSAPPPLRTGRVQRRHVALIFRGTFGELPNTNYTANES